MLPSALRGDENIDSIRRREAAKGLRIATPVTSVTGVAMTRFLIVLLPVPLSPEATRSAKPNGGVLSMG